MIHIIIPIVHTCSLYVRIAGDRLYFDFFNNRFKYRNTDISVRAVDLLVSARQIIGRTSCQFLFDDHRTGFFVFCHFTNDMEVTVIQNTQANVI